MKLVVDMNMSTKWIRALEEGGFEAIHWSEIGDIAAGDGLIAAHAASTGAVVLTRDMDFSAILAVNRLTKPSVVHLRETDRFHPVTVRRVVLALRRFEADLIDGAVVSIAGSRARMRRLPMGGSVGEDQ